MDDQFPPPLIPSARVAETRYPATHRFLRLQVDMQVADLRLLFRLPFADLDPHVGCNFTAAAMMLNLISGFSRWFFHTYTAVAIAEREAQDGRPQSARRFLGFVEAYWPELPPEPSSRESARRLYTVRNSLSHDLGVGEVPPGDEGLDIRLAKRAFALDDIVAVERSSTIHPLTAPVIEERDGTYIVHLIGVYWALHQMLRNALLDRPDQIEEQMQELTIPAVQDVDRR
jgi:hypothetical protein